MAGEAATMAAFLQAMDPDRDVGLGTVATTVSASEADQAIMRSPALIEVSAALEARRLVHPQVWVSTGLEAHKSGLRSDIALCSSPRLLGGKPDRALYTSTRSSDDLGMWSIYLQLMDMPSLYPPPWSAWILCPSPGARIATVTSAVEWCDLVLAHPRETERGLVLDWKAVSRRFDALHVTLAAVASIDSVEFQERGRTIARVVWSVETTVWFRWVFSEVVAGGVVVSPSCD